MRIFDSHIHLCSPEYAGHIPEIMDKFISDGGGRVLTVSYDVESAHETVRFKNDLENRYSDLIDIGLGLHPELFAVNSTLDHTITDMDKMESSIDMLENLISSNKGKISAIGETGLDYKWIKEDPELAVDQLEELIELQKLSFKKHIELSLEYNLPMTIHSRDINGSGQAAEDTIKILSREGKGKIRGVFHSYTGESEFLEMIVGLGFKVGFNGIVTYRSGDNVRKMVSSLPEHSILLETDGPYLVPDKRRRNKKRKFRYAIPSDVIEIGEKIAEVRSEEPEKIFRTNETNYLELFA